jgi:succinate dehydrogenase hydrophobic anchor subunit
MAVNRQIVRHGREFLNHVVPAVIKPARTLWNEVIGFLFLCLAVIFGFNGVRAYLNAEMAKVLLAAPLTLIMAWFGISSFLRARKISRS